MLTNVALKALKPDAKRYKKADSGGLFIFVEANGSKIWRFAYRHDGKAKLLSGGRYPQTSLAAARAWRDKMKHPLALGLDPSEERRKELAVMGVPVGSKFEEVAREWLEARILSWVPKYASRIVTRLETDVFPRRRRQGYRRDHSARDAGHISQDPDARIARDSTPDQELL